MESSASVRPASLSDVVLSASFFSCTVTFAPDSSVQTPLTSSVPFRSKVQFVSPPVFAPTVTDPAEMPSPLTPSTVTVTAAALLLKVTLS